LPGAYYAAKMALGQIDNTVTILIMYYTQPTIYIGQMGSTASQSHIHAS